MEHGKIHDMLDQMEKEINTNMTQVIRVDIHDLQHQLQTVLESMTSLDCHQIDDIVNAALLALCSGELAQQWREDNEEQ